MVNDGDDGRRYQGRAKKDEQRSQNPECDAYSHGLEEAHRRLEQGFDVSNGGFIDQKQNEVVIWLYNDIVVGDHYFVMSDERSDSGARGQAQLCTAC